MVRDPTLAQTLTRLPRRWYHGDSIVDRGEGVLRFVWLVFGTLSPAVVAIVPSPEGAQGIDLLLTAIHNATAVVGYGTLVFMELAQVRLARPNCCPCLASARALPSPSPSANRNPKRSSISARTSSAERGPPSGSAAAAAAPRRSSGRLDPGTLPWRRATTPRWTATTGNSTGTSGCVVPS